jgi:hypothetical protein
VSASGAAATAAADTNGVKSAATIPVIETKVSQASKRAGEKKSKMENTFALKAGLAQMLKVSVKEGVTSTSCRT